MITTLPALFDALWADYAALNPQARAIATALAERGEEVVNDHIALRTFDRAGIGVEALARTFVDAGWAFAGEYAFPDKHLRARHLRPPEAGHPKIFISELRCDALSARARDIVARMLEQMPAHTAARYDLCVCGRPWTPTLADYETLRSESEYAAWLAAFGFRANHFTVDVGALKTITSLGEMNELVRALGFELNTAGGEIKGSPDVYLEQSSTLAAQVAVAFEDGSLQVPACYYEFARRYAMPDGKRFEGFIEGSASRLFESTDSR